MMMFFAKKQLIRKTTGKAIWIGENQSVCCSHFDKVFIEYPIDQHRNFRRHNPDSGFHR